MEASVVDLRYKTKEVLRALERNEEVRLLYRGKMKGRIIPERAEGEAKKVDEHAFFNSSESDEAEVDAIMDELRRGRV
jgi:antitoxin (DNA-binding transcriptional repressor) of toxin-antitoxin stability system